jgi:hypothetical protein
MNHLREKVKKNCYFLFLFCRYKVGFWAFLSQQRMPYINFSIISKAYQHADPKVAFEAD